MSRAFALVVPPGHQYTWSAEFVVGNRLKAGLRGTNRKCCIFRPEALKNRAKTGIISLFAIA